MRNEVKVRDQERVQLLNTCLNPKQARLLQIGMAGRGQILPAPLCNFCLNGPIDLKFGM